MKISQHKLLASLFLTICALIGIEITLRKSLGLASPALLLKDEQTGYRFKPNQKISRFGRRIEYNQFSQRSEPITLTKGKETFRVLMVGDSVLNGGSLTNQADTLTEKLERQITFARNNKVEVLNASAGSWGIGNQAGYIEKFGFFDSDIVILQIGSHDLVQPTSISEIVGKPTHPDKKPLLATQELFTKYIWPKVVKYLNSRKVQFRAADEIQESLADEIPESRNIPLQFAQNMESLTRSYQLLNKQQAPMIILFTPSREDLLPIFSEPDYKSDFLKLSETLNIPVIDVHGEWSKYPEKTVASYFRDKVHLNPIGNEAVAHLIFRYLCSTNLSDICKR